MQIKKTILLLALIACFFSGCSTSQKAFPTTPTAFLQSQTVETPLYQTLKPTTTHTGMVERQASSIPTAPPQDNFIPTHTPVSETLPAPTPPGWIAFANYGVYPYSIDIVHTSGKGWSTLVDRVMYPDAPLWAPGGQWISFRGAPKDGAGRDEIYVVRSDGNMLRRLTFTSGYKSAGSWSSDGNFVVFSNVIGPADQHEVELFAVDVETGQLSQITDTAGLDEYSPVFAPQTNAIAYSVSARKTPYVDYLMVMDLDEKVAKQVIEIQALIRDFAWTFDGEKIAFSASPIGECENIYTVNSDGSGLQQITDSPGSESNPTWSPDGKWIAFMATEDFLTNDICDGGATDWKIGMMDANGSGLRIIMDRPQIRPLSPAWFPLLALEVGKDFTVTEAGANLKLRSSPTLTAQVLGKLDQGKEIVILEGPVEADQYLWWRVEVKNIGQKGWVAESPGWFAPSN